MKTINKIFTSAAVGVAMLFSTGCVGDLDVMPVDPSVVTPSNFKDDPEGYMNRVLADVYLNFATYGANGDSPVKEFDGGMAAFSRALFIAEEIPTDEASWLYDRNDYGDLNFGRTTSAVNWVYGIYSRLMINITLCNDFIRTVNEGLFGLNDAQTVKAQDYIRQCRILRGACYFYLINFFGDTFYADETTAIGSIPPQMKRAEIFNLVTADLEDVVASFEPNQKPAYGFVGLDVAEAVLVKFYLNAKVLTGQERYADCLRHAENIIARLGKGGFNNSGLAKTYTGVFAANNSQYAIGGANEVNEIIWDIPADRIELQTYSGSTFMMAAFLGTDGVQVTDPTKTDWQGIPSYTFNGVDYSFDPEKTAHVSSNWFNISAGWKCSVARQSFVKKFQWVDGAMSESPDERVSLWLTSKFGFASENPSLEGANWGNNGYLPVKYTNFPYDEDGNIDNSLLAQYPGTDAFGSADFAMIRLSEIYLSAAEAIVEGGGDQAKALKYVNFIRERAGVAPATALSQGLVRDERCRELYCENTRRTDLIRYGLWESGYNWEWKNGMLNGSDLPAYTKLYPIPSRVLGTSGYKQNPGY